MVDSQIFNNDYQVVFLFTYKTPFKRKQEVRSLLVKYGGTVSYIITKKTSLVVADSADIATDNYNVKQALKLGIPIVGLKFLDDCIQKRKFLDPSGYTLVAPCKKDEKFDKGQIRAPTHQKKTAIRKRAHVKPESIPIYKLQDSKCPVFSEPRFVKAALLQKADAEVQLYFVLELHRSNNQSGCYKYRVCTQSAKAKKHGSLDVSNMEYRFTDNADTALLVYSSLYTKYTSSGYCQVQQVPANVVSVLGSRLSQEWFQQNMRSSTVDHQVAQAVETFWSEAVGSVEEKIATPVSHLKLSEVEEAETNLRCLQEALKKKKPKSETETLKQEYYRHLPHKSEHKLELNSVKEISTELDLCQLIKDVLAISESTDWSKEVSSLSKYNALHCYVVKLPEDDNDFIDISRLVYDSYKSSKELTIHNIFQVHRQSEETNFLDLDNKMLLFHGSKIQNYVGLLSRGLLLPSTVVEEFGVDRSDAGSLGFGVYFSDSAYTSLKYTSRSNMKGSTFLLVNEVALGDVYHTKTKMMDLKAPPDGYNSVHAIKSSPNERTEFQDDEYAIYDIRQQRIRYLVELSLPDQEIHDIPVTFTEPDVTEKNELDRQTELDISDIKDVANPLSKVKVGLSGDGDERIPLKSVHIRAKLVDLAAKVVILQEYFNDNSRAIEAKYVFPLDDNAAVCGFEAFINGKHIIGTVKEKKEAHKEYREAISMGHGAYLMDEEKADVFTVRVGNLPPKATVLIKITYVAELRVNGELIDFYLPGCVADWDKHVALSEVIQTDVEPVEITKGSVVTTLQVAMEMPFDIRTITSPTHKIKMKKTATKAVVELPKNAHLGKYGFRLQVGLSQIHVPRMWVEKHPDRDSQACMLTFYPEFDAEDILDPDIILLVDCSNSMKGEAMTHAKKVALLALDMLPKTCHFNIIAFGTAYSELFQRTEALTEKLIKEAKNFVVSLTATQGNTNVWNPLEMLGMLPSEHHPHNVYLVSDGHLNHVNSLLKLISDNRMVNRIFTLSVGPTPDLYVMKTVARIGGGSSQYYDPSLKSKWQNMVQSQLLKAAQPNLTAVQVEWQQFDEKPYVQAPRALMSLYSGQREVIYGFVENCTMAVLKAEVDGYEMSTVVSTHELNVTTGKILHTLTARAVINDWQNGLLAEDKIEHEVIKLSHKSDIINLSKQYSVVTPFTSFVAIEERAKEEEPKQGPSVDELVAKENVDILDYVDWQITVEEEVAVDQKIEQLLEKASIAESYSVCEASRLYKQIMRMLPELGRRDKHVMELKQKARQRLSRFYKEVSRSELTGEEYELLEMGTRKENFPSFGHAEFDSDTRTLYLKRKSKYCMNIHSLSRDTLGHDSLEEFSRDVRMFSDVSFGKLPEQTASNSFSEVVWPASHLALQPLSEQLLPQRSRQISPRCASMGQGAPLKDLISKQLSAAPPQQQIAKLTPPRPAAPPQQQVAKPTLSLQIAAAPSQIAKPPQRTAPPPPPQRTVETTPPQPAALPQQQIAKLTPPQPAALPQQQIAKLTPPRPAALPQQQIAKLTPPRPAALPQQQVAKPTPPQRTAPPPPPPPPQQTVEPTPPQTAAPSEQDRLTSSSKPNTLPPSPPTVPLGMPLLASPSQPLGSPSPHSSLAQVPASPPLLAPLSAQSLHQLVPPTAPGAFYDQSAEAEQVDEYCLFADYSFEEELPSSEEEYYEARFVEEEAKLERTTKKKTSEGMVKKVYWLEGAEEKMKGKDQRKEEGGGSLEREGDSVNVITDVLNKKLELLNTVLKEKSSLFQWPLFDVQLSKLETNMKESLDIISNLKNQMAEYDKPTRPGNFWTAMMLTKRSLKRRSSLDSLFRVKQDVHWNPDAELGKLIGVDFDNCKKILLEAGLRSLGVKAEIEVMQFLATVFALLSVLHLTSDISAEMLRKYVGMNLQITDITICEREDSILFQLRSTGEAILESNISKERRDILALTGLWLIEEDRKYPMVADMLELSATKVTILLQMLEALLTVREG